MEFLTTTTTNNLTVSVDISNSSEILCLSCNSSFTLLSTNWTYQNTESDLFVNIVSMRNSIISIIAAVLTLFSIPITLKTQLKVPIKASLLNLSVNNFMLVSVGVGYGALQVSSTTDTVQCQACVITIVFCFLLMHLSVLGISLNNFCAVKYPFFYRSVNQTKVVVFSLLSAWLGTAVLSFILVYNNIEGGLACSCLNVIPRYSVCVIASFMLIVDSFVLVLDITNCRTLFSRKNKIAVKNAQVQMDNAETVRPAMSIRIPKKGASCGFPSFLTKLEAANPGSTNIRNSGLIDISEYMSYEAEIQIKRKRWKSLSFSTKKDKTDFTTSTLQKTEIYSNTSVNLISVRSCPANTTMEHRDLTTPRRNSLNEVKSQSSRTSRGDQPFLIHVNNPTFMTEASCSRSSTSDGPFSPQATAKRGNRHRRRRTIPASAACLSGDNRNTRLEQQFKRIFQQSASLTIISLWSFLLNFPFVLFALYLGAFSEDRTVDLYSPVGVAATSATVANVIGDPFLYAWRFVSWTDVYNKLKSSCGIRDQS